VLGLGIRSILPENNTPKSSSVAHWVVEHSEIPGISVSQAFGGRRQKAFRNSARVRFGKFSVMLSVTVWSCSALRMYLCRSEKKSQRSIAGIVRARGMGPEKTVTNL